MFTTAGSTRAAEDTTGSGKTDNNPIRVTSDQMESDSEARYVEFIGNVKATQGATVITADRLKVYYKGNPEKSVDSGPGEENIEKMVSTGSVVIHFDNRVAKAEEAIYTVKSRILLLIGPKASITSGKNTVAGEKITLYRDEGRIQVERSKNEQVEATFFSGGKGLN